MPSSSNAFVIPEGIQLELTEAGISIEHDGDIVIDGELNVDIRRLHSRSGDIHIGRSMEVSELVAENGAIQIEGNLKTEAIRAKRIDSAGSLEAGSLSTTGGDLNVTGELLTEELSVAGAIRIGGKTTATNISASSDASFGQGLECTELLVEGNLLLGGPARARGIVSHGKEIIVKQSLEVVEIFAEDSSIQLEGDTQIQLLRARAISIGGNENKIKALQAQESISISEGFIMSDVMIAPKVEMHPQARGRIMVVETEGVLGPHSVKGCLQLEDLAPLIPDPEAFLTQRGVNHLGNPAPERREEEPEAPGHGAPELEAAEAEVETGSESEEIEAAEADASETAGIYVDPAGPAESQEDSLEELPIAIVEEEPPLEIGEDSAAVEDPGSDAPAAGVDSTDDSDPDAGEINLTSPIDFDDEEELFPEEGNHLSGSQKATVILHSVAATEPTSDEAVIGPNPASAPVDLEEEPLEQSSPREEGALDPGTVDDPFLADIMAETNNIIDSYEGSKPEALTDLVGLIQSEDYGNLREEMKNIWSKLLKHHQRHKTRIPGQVILSFNHINSRLNQL
jgi:hypothetical protein